jgi:hypothetical protein
MEWIPRERNKWISKKNMDGRSTSSHDNKKLITRSMEKQTGMVFGIWKKMVTAVKKTKQIDRY